MKLYDLIVSFEKPKAYDYYARFISNPKKYERVTRKQMATEIVNQMLEENFLFHFINTKGRVCLSVLRNNPTEEQLKQQFIQCINLVKELILDENLEVFDELKDEVNRILEEFNPNEVAENQVLLIDVLVGLANLYYSAPFDLFIKSAAELLGKDEKTIEGFISHPRFLYYTFISHEDLRGKDVEFLNYNYNIFMHEEIKEFKKNNALSCNIEVSLPRLASLSHNGICLVGEYGERLLSIINDSKDGKLYEFILAASYTGEFDALNKYIETYYADVADEMKTIFDNIPCIGLGGLSAVEHKQEVEKINKSNLALSHERQLDACLSVEEADLFYKVYFGLLEYTNVNYKIKPGMKIYKALHVDPLALREIDTKLWSNINFIVKNFVRENPYKFNKEELKVVEDFKKSTAKTVFFVCGFTKDYTMMLDSKSNMYMVKGVRCNIDQVVDKNNIPAAFETTLLMFKGKIIYSSVLGALSIQTPSQLLDEIVEVVKKGNYKYKL